MNVENNNQPTGSLKISQDVLATIANFASEEIDGVVSLANTYAPIKSLLKEEASAGRFRSASTTMLPLSISVST